MSEERENSEGYKGHEEDRAKVINALGGTRGLLDTGLPSLLFLIVFDITKSITTSGIYALALSAVLAIIRLIKRETLQHAISGILGTAICALFSRKTGHAVDFYLPGLFINLGYAIVYIVTNLANWPILGVMLGPILGENFEWRKHPARLAVYVKAGWLWVGLFISRLLIQYPLYRAKNVNALGLARLVMGYPLFLFVVWMTWRVIRAVPSVKPEE
jgi:Protein of unknown function (DUF3159)